MSSHLPGEEDASKLLNTIFLGEVASTQAFGAFIRIPGTSQKGLVHKSQLSSARVDDVSEVLKRGERVWCKVINITDDNKIGLSMKVVNQGSGKDLDPNGVIIHEDQRRRKEQPTGGGRRVIELQAVFNTTCSKCGTRGHLSQDCFQTPGGKKYDLLPEEDDPRPVQQPEEEAAVPIAQKTVKPKKEKKKKKRKKKKEKKEKKSKRKRKSRSTSSSSSEDSSSSEEDRKARKRSRSESDEAAKKKRRHSSKHKESR